MNLEFILTYYNCPKYYTALRTVYSDVDHDIFLKPFPATGKAIAYINSWYNSEVDMFTSFPEHKSMYSNITFSFVIYTLVKYYF